MRYATGHQQQNERAQTVAKTRRCRAMLEKGSEEGLLVKAEPLGLAEKLSRRIVDVRVVNGALLLDADPAWAWAINTVLVMKGVRVTELRPTRFAEQPSQGQSGAVHCLGLRMEEYKDEKNDLNGEEKVEN
jgi:hypothetical protein